MRPSSLIANSAGDGETMCGGKSSRRTTHHHRHVSAPRSHCGGNKVPRQVFFCAGVVLLLNIHSSATSAFQPSSNWAPVSTGSMRRRHVGSGNAAIVAHSNESSHLMQRNENDYVATLDSSSKFQPSPQAKKDFHNKNILITGASGGLGRCLAHQLVKCSASTLILSARNIEKLEAVAEECRNITSLYAPPETTKVEVVQCDLTDASSVDHLGQRALELCSKRSSGAVDVLINNGGISSRSDFVDTAIEVDEMLMQVNFLSGARLAKRVVPSMMEGGLGNNGKGGCIIWISSVQGLLGIPSRTSYAASKFAVQGYCEALRAELAGSDISVHVISPGYIRTDLSKSAMTGDGRLYGKMDDTTANGADPEEVAVAVLDGVAKRRSGSKGGSSDFVVAAGLSAKIAIWLRLLAPGFLEKKLQNRYDKSKEK